MAGAQKVLNTRQPVDPTVPVACRAFSQIYDHAGWGAFITGHIITGTTAQHVVSALARQNIITGPTIEYVVPTVTAQPVSESTAVEVLHMGKAIKIPWRE